MEAGQTQTTTTKTKNNSKKKLQTFHLFLIAIVPYLYES